MIHTKHINTLCGHNAELLNAKPDGVCVCVRVFRVCVCVCVCVYIYIYNMRGYYHLKEKALDRIKWRNRFGRGFGPVV